MQLKFYFDQNKCINCNACVVACKSWNNLDGISYRRVITKENGKFPDVSVENISVSCNHCQEPACQRVCPIDAISKDKENGVVNVNQDKCIGCMKCKEVCSIDAPQFLDKINAKMQKCDFCYDRLGEGKAPICVKACIMRTLKFGTLANN
ncbi:4Fe-4S dicluster domain-containing protein [Selenihalanaerobacter shriftii]|uniref:Anaerobic dimethyl sulfoxide reductase subunit B (DMSO reductase iron-sulfur subunit) n=1 Tax=Selenihalanaerobacter shriftii TaxID=142842 RepID=A0A1T4LRD0_9FIRM|nr:4Fe-4S dicluster domain-containing protein [Selenihalanaerobacter shriftii]SJZ57197.1 anaerobic dimethyl sulfoxide reductase subunit B (DMSO reductase iron-sulfur subunit) [Selenihalanaerobacter shriftii]